MYHAIGEQFLFLHFSFLPQPCVFSLGSASVEISKYSLSRIFAGLSTTGFSKFLQLAVSFFLEPSYFIIVASRCSYNA